MKEQKRGKNVAIAALVLQVLLLGSCIAIWRWTNAEAMFSAAMMIAGGAAVWAMVALLFYARQLAQREQRELAEIEAQGAASSLFDEADRLAARPAQAKVELLNKWIVPIFTICLAGYYIGVGWWVLSAIRPIYYPTEAHVPSNPHSGLLLLVLGFGAFLWSRYALGMATEPEWRPLRSAASLLFGHVLFLLLIVVEMGMVYWGKGTFGQGHYSLDSIVASIFPIVMFVFAAEILINLVMDLYRPRIPGQEQRMSFDSRLLNLLAQPEQVGHSLAEALNYQFGFEVSRTWFYQLLSRAVAPLLLFAAVVLLLMSSVVIVHNDQSAVILRLGRIDPQREPLGPGIHLKWPWPIDTARFFNTGDVKKLVLGVHEDQQESYLRDIYRPGTNVKRVLLWKVAHEGEKSYLMAQPPRDGQQGAATVALGNLVFVVNYRIDDVYTYGFKYNDTDRLLADIAETELTRLAATTTLLESAEELGDVDPDRPRSVMTVGRQRAADVLKKRLSNALAERGGLGVKITYVGLPNVHPPSGAAEAYEDVVKAQLSILAKEYQAEGAAAEALAEVAGDPLIARLLAQSIDTRQKISELESYLRADPPDLDELAKALDSYIHQASQRVEMYNTRIGREKLLGRLTNRRIEEVSSQVQAGEATLRDLAHRDVNDVLVMLLAHRRQLHLLEQIESRRAAGEQIALAETLERTNRRINSLFEEAYGEPAKLIAEARAQRRGLELAERTSAESFQRRLAAWRASPNMYELDRRLDVLERVLPEIETKFVVGVDPNRLQLWHDRTGQAESLAEIPWGQQPGASE